MSYKDILVFLDDEEFSGHRVDKAIALAKLHGARLTGVTLVRLVPRYLKVTETRAIARYALQAAEKRVSEFTSLSEAAGVTAVTRMFKGNEARAARGLARFSRNFDLLMLGQASPKSRNASVYEEVAEKIILLSGRPTIFTPYIGARRLLDRKAVIAWDGSPSAARAVHDAIPILRNINEVVILVVREGKDKSSRERTLAGDLAEHLRRHDINVEIKLISAGTYSVPTVIQNEIADNNFDLLVMGGYGTPNLKQKIFGGVTRTILSSMIVPVLMSH